MGQNLPKSKTGQLADILRIRIESGEWKETIPPERLLAEDLLVSRTTLRKALEILQHDGWIAPAESSRSCRRILTPEGKPNSAVPSGLVVVITPSMFDNPLLLEHLAVLRDLLGRGGARIEVREAARIAELRQPKNELARLAAKFPGAVWILYRMPQPVQIAAGQLGLRCIVYGSVLAGVDLPYVDVDFRAVARHALGRCLARGLRKIAVLVHRTPLAGDTVIVSEITSLLAGAGAPPPVILRHDFNRSRLIDSLDQRIVPADKTPDALIVVSQHHLLTTLPHLLRRGLRIPDDLSLIYLSNDPVTERLSPLPERYDLGGQLPRRLAKAAQAMISGEIPSSARLLPKLKAGETFRNSMT